MSKIKLASIDVSETDKRHVVWCSLDGVNTGATGDTGELGGATISTSTWSVVSGTATLSSSSVAAVTINYPDGTAVSYAINTVATITISGVTADSDGNLVLLDRITTSDGRTLDQTVIIPVEEH